METVGCLKDKNPAKKNIGDNKTKININGMLKDDGQDSDAGDELRKRLFSI